MKYWRPHERHRLLEDRRLIEGCDLVQVRFVPRLAGISEDVAD
jgi:hypothetical protein